MFCINVRAREDKDACLWTNWTAPGDAQGATIHVLGRDELRDVLRRLPCKERYLAVCKLFRSELAAIAASATRLRWQLHPTHDVSRCDCAALARCPCLVSVEDSHACWDARWPRVLDGALHLETLRIAPVRWSRGNFDAFAAAVARAGALRELDIALPSLSAAVALAAALPACEALAAVTARGLLSQKLLDALPACGCLGAVALHVTPPPRSAAADPADWRPLSRCEALRALRVCGSVEGDLAPAVDSDALWGAAAQCAALESAALALGWPSTRRRDCAPEGRPEGPAPAATRLRELSIVFGQRPEDFVQDEFLQRTLDLRVLFADLACMPALERVELASAPRAVFDGVLAARPLAPCNTLELLSQLPAWPTLRSLRLRLVTDVVVPRATQPLTMDGVDLSDCCETLELSGSFQRPLLASVCTGRCPLLTSLSLAHCPAPRENAALQTWFETTPPLERLALAGLRRSVLEGVARSLPLLPALTRLEITHNAPSDVVELANQLPLCPRLRSLALHGLDLPAASELFPAIAECSALRCLEVSGHGVLRQLARLLPALPALEELVMRGEWHYWNAAFVGNPAAEWAQVGAALSSCTALRTLRIEHSRNFPIARTLSAAVAACPALQEVAVEKSESWAQFMSRRLAAKGRAAARVASDRRVLIIATGVLIAIPLLVVLGMHQQYLLCLYVLLVIVGVALLLLYVLQSFS